MAKLPHYVHTLILHFFLLLAHRAQARWEPKPCTLMPVNLNRMKPEFVDYEEYINSSNPVHVVVPNEIVYNIIYNIETRGRETKDVQVGFYMYINNVLYCVEIVLTSREILKAELEKYDHYFVKDFHAVVMCCYKTWVIHSIIVLDDEDAMPMPNKMPMPLINHYAYPSKAYNVYTFIKDNGLTSAYPCANYDITPSRPTNNFITSNSDTLNINQDSRKLIYGMYYNNLNSNIADYSDLYNGKETSSAKQDTASLNAVPNECILSVQGKTIDISSSYLTPLQLMYSEHSLGEITPLESNVNLELKAEKTQPEYFEWKSNLKSCFPENTILSAQLLTPVGLQPETAITKSVTYPKMKMDHVILDAQLNLEPNLPENTLKYLTSDLATTDLSLEQILPKSLTREELQTAQALPEYWTPTEQDQYLRTCVTPEGLQSEHALPQYWTFGDKILDSNLPKYLPPTELQLENALPQDLIQKKLDQNFSKYLTLAELQLEEDLPQNLIVSDKKLENNLPKYLTPTELQLEEVLPQNLMLNDKEQPMTATAEIQSRPISPQKIVPDDWNVVRSIPKYLTPAQPQLEDALSQNLILNDKKLNLNLPKYLPPVGLHMAQAVPQNLILDYDKKPDQIIPKYLTQGELQLDEAFPHNLISNDKKVESPRYLTPTELKLGHRFRSTLTPHLIQNDRKIQNNLLSYLTPAVYLNSAQRQSSSKYMTATNQQQPLYLSPEPKSENVISQDLTPKEAELGRNYIHAESIFDKRFNQAENAEEYLKSAQPKSIMYLNSEKLIPESEELMPVEQYFTPVESMQEQYTTAQRLNSPTDPVLIRYLTPDAKPNSRYRTMSESVFPNLQGRQSTKTISQISGDQTIPEGYPTPEECLIATDQTSGKYLKMTGQIPKEDVTAEPIPSTGVINLPAKHLSGSTSGKFIGPMNSKTKIWAPEELTLEALLSPAALKTEDKYLPPTKDGNFADVEPMLESPGIYWSPSRSKDRYLALTNPTRRVESPKICLPCTQLNEVHLAPVEPLLVSSGYFLPTRLKDRLLIPELSVLESRERHMEPTENVDVTVSHVTQESKERYLPPTRSNYLTPINSKTERLNYGQLTVVPVQESSEIYKASINYGDLVTIGPMVKTPERYLPPKWFNGGYLDLDSTKGYETPASMMGGYPTPEFLSYARKITDDDLESAETRTHLASSDSMLKLLTPAQQQGNYAVPRMEQYLNQVELTSEQYSDSAENENITPAEQISERFLTTPEMVLTEAISKEMLTPAESIQEVYLTSADNIDITATEYVTENNDILDMEPMNDKYYKTKTPLQEHVQFSDTPKKHLISKDTFSDYSTFKPVLGNHITTLEQEEYVEPSEPIPDAYMVATQQSLKHAESTSENHLTTKYQFSEQYFTPTLIPSRYMTASQSYESLGLAESLLENDFTPQQSGLKDFVIPEKSKTQHLTSGEGTERYLIPTITSSKNLNPLPKLNGSPGSIPQYYFSATEQMLKKDLTPKNPMTQTYLPAAESRSNGLTTSVKPTESLLTNVISDKWAINDVTEKYVSPTMPLTGINFLPEELTRYMSLEEQTPSKTSTEKYSSSKELTSTNIFTGKYSLPEQLTSIKGDFNQPTNTKTFATSYFSTEELESTGKYESPMDLTPGIEYLSPKTFAPRGICASSDNLASTMTFTGKAVSPEELSTSDTYVSPKYASLTTKYELPEKLTPTEKFLSVMELPPTKTNERKYVSPEELISPGKYLTTKELTLKGKYLTPLELPSTKTFPGKYFSSGELTSTGTYVTPKKLIPTETCGKYLSREEQINLYNYLTPEKLSPFTSSTEKYMSPEETIPLDKYLAPEKLSPSKPCTEKYVSPEELIPLDKYFTPKKISTSKTFIEKYLTPEELISPEKYVTREELSPTRNYELSQKPTSTGKYVAPEQLNPPRKYVTPEKFTPSKTSTGKYVSREEPTFSEKYVTPEKLWSTRKYESPEKLTPTGKCLSLQELTSTGKYFPPESSEELVSIKGDFNQPSNIYGNWAPKEFIPTKIFQGTYLPPEELTSSKGYLSQYADNQRGEYLSPKDLTPTNVYTEKYLSPEESIPTTGYCDQFSNTREFLSPKELSLLGKYESPEDLAPQETGAFLKPAETKDYLKYEDLQAKTLLKYEEPAATYLTYKCPILDTLSSHLEPISEKYMTPEIVKQEISWPSMSEKNLKVNEIKPEKALKYVEPEPVSETIMKLEDVTTEAFLKYSQPLSEAYSTCNNLKSGVLLKLKEPRSERFLTYNKLKTDTREQLLTPTMSGFEKPCKKTDLTNTESTLGNVMPYSLLPETPTSNQLENLYPDYTVNSNNENIYSTAVCNDVDSLRSFVKASSDIDNLYPQSSPIESPNRYPLSKLTKDFKTNVLNFLNSTGVKNYIYTLNDNRNLMVGDIGIAKYDPTGNANKFTINTANNDINQLLWYSKLKLMKVRVILEPFDQEILNVLPIVKNKSNYNPKSIAEIAKDAVTKVYGTPIEIKGIYSHQNPYAIVDNQNINAGSNILLWPTYCDCGCEKCGCNCFWQNL